MKVLSLFDGMACGMLAMQKAGIEVDRYVAYEIDKYATQTASHNFPMIEQRGDVFQTDFTEYSDFDFLIGGSPCTYWSIAQKNNRETEASGMGWELFSQYVRALHEAKPKFFVYENNKSMSKAIRDSIDKAFGFEAICINTKATSGADGKTYPVYEVKDGKITIKGKQYPIKLADGYYIIRKLTVRECMRLQTVPEWYEFPVSDSQAYKMLGNGWTVEVIAHLLKGCMAAGEPVQCEKNPQKVIVRRANRG